ncbi:hypothetical protein DYH09_29715 [bacterium CPR1]|nr:hypothetical protein [bacterium CPR1]
MDSRTAPEATSRTAGGERERDSAQISEEARSAQGEESARSPVNFSTWGLDGKNGNGAVGQVDAPGSGKNEPKPGSEEARLVERAASQGLQLDKGELLSRARGSEGSKVKQLQEMLNKNGARLEADGIMGRDTSRAVRDFQRKQKLKMIDGVVGPETQEALNRMQQPAPPATQGQRPPDSTAVDPARQTSGPTPLTLGQKPPANMSVRPPETNMSVRPPETNMSVRPPEGSTQSQGQQQADTRAGLPPTTPAGGEKVNLGRLSTLQSAQRNPDGSYSFKAGATIDVDGSGPKYGDPHAQSQTSLSLKGNPKYPNADKVPYYVLPPQVAKKMGAKVGDLGMISYKGKSIAAVFADVGPRNRIGELSRNAALQLGIPASPTTGGVPSGVEYRVFPGSRGDKRPSAADLTPEKLTQRVQQLTGTQQADQERKAGETGASTVGGATQVQPVGQTQAQSTEAVGPTNKLPVPHGLRGIMQTFGPAGSKNLRSVRAAAGPGGKEIPVSMHTKVADQFKQAFDEIKRQGLSSEIQSFDGSYNHRPKKGRSKGLSTHSWGIAFDVNADRYPYGTSPAQTSQKFRQIAEILKSHGFHQLPNDAHHFQYATGY